MRMLFLVLLAFLIVFSQAITLKQKGIGHAGKPVLVWATGINPARQEQVEEFYRWLKKNGYPEIEIRMDNVGLGLQKFIIQGTSGVAADLVDIFSGNLSSTFYLRQMGILEGVDDLEKKFGYPDREVWEPLRSMLYEDGMQVAFPGNHAPEGVILNLDIFRKVGMAAPTFDWTFDDFERLGAEYSRRAASVLGKNYFFMAALPTAIFRRSAGLPLWNETMTRPALNTPRYVALLKTMDRWQRVLHLAPSAAESQSFSTGQSAMMGNWQWQIFNQGNFACMTGNSAALIQLRLMKPQVNYGACLPPHDGFPNVMAKTRSIGLYAGSRNKELAKYFLAYLRSEEYNLLVIRQTDAIPPNIKYLAHESFMRPEGHTNEWPLHQAFRVMVEKYAAPMEFTPFALMPDIDRWEARYLAEYGSELISAEQVVQRTEAAFTAEVEKYLARRPVARAAYAKALERQKTIDALKAAGKMVPAELIDNPFSRAAAKRGVPR